MARIRSKTNAGSPMVEPTGDDDVSNALRGIVERARPILQQRQTARVRDRLTESQPLVSPDTPLSPRSVAHLATYGISGPRTYGDAKKHLEQTASSFGLPVGGTKKITESGTTTNTAGFVRAKIDPGQRPTMPSHEAELLDMVDTLHRGISGFMRHPTSSADPVSNRVEKLQAAAAIEDANPTPQEAPKSSPSRTPRNPRTQLIKKATKNINASDRPLADLPPAKNSRELTRRQKMIDAEKAALTMRKRTADLEALKRVTAGHEAITVEHGPGGWATRTDTPPATTSDRGTPKVRNSPVDMASAVKSSLEKSKKPGFQADPKLLDKAKDLLAKADAKDAEKLAARAKYPEDDSPVY